MSEANTEAAAVDQSELEDPRPLAPMPVITGPPFGPEFFATVLAERVTAACDGRPEEIPVVELHLAGGLTLDLCHVPVVERSWLAADVYRDKETCKEMDLVFVPYGLVTRVTVSLWHRSQRPIGFALGRGAA